jgi:UDP-N-acetylmuramoyl-tripeptide--D-alanyl-D-alanine ligase
MPKLSIEEIARAVGGRIHGGAGLGGVVAGYAFDTRRLKPGEVFFALTGEERDGHDFVGDASARGASAAVVARQVANVPGDFVQIVVPSPLKALQQLARHVRAGLALPVVAISGSNGKTTTKEMLAAILSRHMRVGKSPGNFNNHIGVPLSILGLEENDEVLVMELGSNHKGEIRKLCGIARPDIGLITNIGKAHIGHFGSLEAIATEKTDLLRCLGPGGRGVVNADDVALMSSIHDVGAELTRFSVREASEFQASGIDQIDGQATAFSVRGVPIRLKSPGIHNAYNAVAALATASLLGVELVEAVSALESFEPARMKVESACGLTIVDDTYNANPDSVFAALEVVSKMSAARKFFVMGEMLELGDLAEDLHAEVGDRVAASGIDLFVGIGGLTRLAVEAARSAGLDETAARFFQNKVEAKTWLHETLRAGDLLLVKGSRMARLEEICEFLRQEAVEGRC